MTADWNDLHAERLRRAFEGQPVAGPCKGCLGSGEVGPSIDPYLCPACGGRGVIELDREHDPMCGAVIQSREEPTEYLGCVCGLGEDATAAAPA